MADNMIDQEGVKDSFITFFKRMIPLVASLVGSLLGALIGGGNSEAAKVSSIGGAAVGTLLACNI